MQILTEELFFPDIDAADEEGLLAIGGDLSKERLLLAYSKGIFPWYSEPVIGWYSPDPRFVLYPSGLKISKSMRSMINNRRFHFTTNKAFAGVIDKCKTTPRKEQDGTWISEDIKQAYITLHEAGYAHSAEVWQDGELVGGLYGVRLGKVFFGESMFSTVSNASKYAFIKYVELLKTQNVELIDCQVYTEHLSKLGAKLISRPDFVKLLKLYIDTAP